MYVYVYILSFSPTRKTVKAESISLSTSYYQIAGQADFCKLFTATCLGEKYQFKPALLR